MDSTYLASPVSDWRRVLNQGKGGHRREADASRNSEWPPKCGRAFEPQVPTARQVIARRLQVLRKH